MLIASRPLALHLHHLVVQVLPGFGPLASPNQLLLQVRPERVESLILVDYIGITPIPDNRVNFANTNMLLILEFTFSLLGFTPFPFCISGLFYLEFLSQENRVKIVLF